jgi:hypothetical protein
MRVGTGLLGLAFLLVHVNAFAQTSNISPEVATCDSGRTLVRSRVLISPDGNYQAYSQSEAMMWPESGCINTSELFVKGPDDKQFRLVYLQEPHTTEGFNLLTLVDWSPNSHQLLAELFISSQFGTDFGSRIPLLYKATEGVFSDENWLKAALSSHFSHDCYANFDARGFSADGGYVFTIYAVYEGDTSDNPIEANSCVKKDGIWQLNYEDSKGWMVKQVAATYRVRRYGRFVTRR